MTSEPCDACGESVRIAGGIANIWSFTHEPSGGMTIEFPTGEDFFLCFQCLDALPEDATAADVATFVAAGGYEL